MKNNISKREIEELKSINAYTEENIKKLENNYPVQYLIGYVNFYGLKINVNESTLIPRYETEYLVEKTIKYINNFKMICPKILDLCTGSGAIGLTLKHEIPCSVTLSDISTDALKVATQNSKELNLDVNIIESDLLNNIKKEEYDVIISNPPYISYNEEIMDIVKNNEPNIALFADNEGLYYYEEILKSCKDYLNDEYLIAFEIGATQKDKIIALVNKYLPNSNIISKKDMQGRDRMIFIMNKK